jgi:RNA polymerase primary sigma factor
MRTVAVVSQWPVRRRLDDGDSPSSTPISDAEIEAYLTRARARSSSASMSSLSRGADAAPPLSAEAQGEMVAAYQAALAEVEAAGQTRRQGAGRGRDSVRARRAQSEADRCLNYLVTSNFRLVHVIARDLVSRRYPSRDRMSEMLPDLIQEGNFALTQAAQRFDPSRNLSFPKYAARAVRDRVRYVLSEQTPTKMPSAWGRTHRIARHLIPELTTSLGRRPSTEELQAALLEKALEWAADHLTEEDAALDAAGRYEAMMAKLRKQGMLGAIEKIEDILTLSQQMSSLDASIGDGTTTLSEMIVDDSSADDTFDPVELVELRQALDVAMAELTDREREIISLRYGFVDGEMWTYERIRPRFGVTAERIRQIERQVLDKLRSPTGSYAALSAFLPTQIED